MNAEERMMIQEAAETAAKTAVRETMTTLGIDHRNPLDVQKDMAHLRGLRLAMDDPEYQRDMLHLRKWRMAMDAVESKGIMAAIGFVIIGGTILAVITLAIKFNLIR